AVVGGRVSSASVLAACSAGSVVRDVDVDESELRPRWAFGVPAEATAMPAAAQPATSAAIDRDLRVGRMRSSGVERSIRPRNRRTPGTGYALNRIRPRAGLPAARRPAG